MHLLVEAINLSKLDFEVFALNAENLTFKLSVSCNSHYPEDNILIQVIEFRVNEKVENPPFKLNATFISQFRCDGEGEPTLQDFAKYNAPAYVVPYARELIATMTSRAGIIPTLVLPPINVFDLMNKDIDVDSPTLGLEDTIPD